MWGLWWGAVGLGVLAGLGWGLALRAWQREAALRGIVRQVRAERDVAWADLDRSDGEVRALGRQVLALEKEVVRLRGWVGRG